MEDLPDYSKLKVPELKKELKIRGLNTSGHKAELLERLQNALKNKTDIGSADSVDDLDEDLLEGDDDDHLDENDSELNFDTNIEAENLKTVKRKATDEENVASKQQKKIVLNRTVSTKEVNNSKENVDDVEDKKEAPLETKKIVKLSELSAKERLEMRAKKFGTNTVVDSKKSQRAERFGLTTDNNQAKLSNAEVSSTVDVLKQRAERFGVCVSTTLSKLNNAEKLEKRKERFGNITLNNSATIKTDKAQERLQRFKQPVP